MILHSMSVTFWPLPEEFTQFWLSHQKKFYISQYTWVFKYRSVVTVLDSMTVTDLAKTGFPEQKGQSWQEVLVWATAKSSILGPMASWACRQFV